MDEPTSGGDAMGRRSASWTASVFFAAPALLFAPVLYYSLTTPFGLVDDYGHLPIIIRIDGAEPFLQWLGSLLLDTGGIRYRPFFEFYNAVTWNIFGPNPWLHHLARWVMHFGAIFAFAAAFLRFSRPTCGRPPLLRLAPLGVLIYLWAFFPNVPAARLGPQEVNTVFFLGLCTWMMARMASRPGVGEGTRSTPWTDGLFVVGFVGLAWSKEVNIAVMLWLLISCHLLLLMQARRPPASGDGGAVLRLPVDWWRIPGGLFMLAVFLHTFHRASIIHAAGGYGTAPLTPGLVSDNALWILHDLLQWDTSPFITAVLVLLTVALLFFVAGKALRGQCNREWFFVLFLLGQFASLFLILCTSWEQVLRYWYPLIPVFATLLAFSAKFMLEFIGERRPGLPGWRARVPAYGLWSFVLFFIFCNYYNFLFQTVVQHHIRRTEAALLTEITGLVEAGHHVEVANREPNELRNNIVRYYRDFLPTFHGVEYPIHEAPPETVGAPYYSVQHARNASPVSGLPDLYPLLGYASRAAEAAQFGAPYRSHDAGVTWWTWYLHDDRLDRVWWNGVELGRLLENAGDPIVRSVYDIYYSHRRLIYVKTPCDPADRRTFFLHLEPVDPDDLPARQRPYGFDNLDFEYEDLGIRRGGNCLAVRELPGYAIRRISTGQYVTGEGNIWRRDFRVDIYHLIREAGEPIVRSDYDVYYSGDELIYMKAPCDPTAQPKFFLHLEPVDPDDLPAGREPHGVDNLDFEYEDLGVRIGGGCFVVRELPDYAIRRISTGQYAPGEGEIWRRDLHVDIYDLIRESGDPIIRSDYDVYYSGDELIYMKAPCDATDQPRFFLHLEPVELNDLPARRKRHGVDNLDFEFEDLGVRVGGNCLAVRELPEYAIKSIRTGQYAPGEGEIRVWSGSSDLQGGR